VRRWQREQSRTKDRHGAAATAVPLFQQLQSGAKNIAKEALLYLESQRRIVVDRTNKPMVYRRILTDEEQRWKAAIDHAQARGKPSYDEPGSQPRYDSAGPADRSEFEPG
jgi:hypothetical protein